MGCILFSHSQPSEVSQLQELEISNCSLLEEIVEGARGDEASSIDKKTIAVFQLRSVILHDLPNLKSFIRSGNYELYMSALTKVVIVNCGFSTLFTCSMFRKLHHLAEIYVSNCRMLESIVLGDDETSFPEDKIITFSRLTSVSLSSLPNLICFSSTSSYAFSMPKLKSFSMDSCPEMEFFTFLKTSTPVVHVYTEQRQWERIPELNNYIRHKCKRGNSLSDGDGKSGYGAQELETKPEIVEEEGA